MVKVAAVKVEPKKPQLLQNQLMQLQRGKSPMMNSKPKYKLTDKDFNQINRRSLFGFQLGWNYERMQNTDIYS